MSNRFSTAVNCMDGRVQLPLIEYLKEHTKADYVDMITEAGPVQYLASATGTEYDSILQRIRLSIEFHGSTDVAICAHADCGGNPVPHENQKKELAAAATVLKNNFGDHIQIITLWIDSDMRVHRLNG
ncbi:MAG: carbonic anhydrase [Spirochaetota bacterium]